jgi:hypothetical protein
MAELRQREASSIARVQPVASAARGEATAAAISEIHG